MANKWPEISFAWKMRLTLLGLVLMALTSPYWQPLIPDYWRGILFGEISGILIGRIIERRKAHVR